MYVFGNRLGVGEDAGGCSGEKLPWKREPVSVAVLCYHSSTAGVGRGWGEGVVMGR